MKTYSAGMRYGKVGKRHGRSKKKQVQKNGEWVEIPKVIKTPNVKVKKDALVVLNKSESQLQEIDNFFTKLATLEKQSEILEKQLQEIETQKEKMINDVENLSSKLIVQLAITHDKLQQAQWVSDPFTSNEFTPFCNVRNAFDDIEFVNFQEASYPWGAKEIKAEFNRLKKDAVKFVKQMKKTLNETKKPFVYTTDVFKEAKEYQVRPNGKVAPKPTTKKGKRHFR
jgi:hypothetical protein